MFDNSNSVKSPDIPMNQAEDKSMRNRADQAADGVDYENLGPGRNAELSKFDTLYIEKIRKDLKRIPVRIGWFKSLLLMRRGRRDGLLCLPRLSAQIWGSPFVQKEQHIVETYRSQKWCEHEIFVAEKQKTARDCAKRISDLQKSLDEMREELPSLEVSLDADAVLEQEAAVSAEVIRSRRQREWRKSHSDFFARKAKFEADLERYKALYMKAQSEVEESAAITKLLCEKKRNFHKQRVAVYYHGVLKSHPDRKTMPPFIELHWDDNSEKMNEQMLEKTEV